MNIFDLIALKKISDLARTVQQDFVRHEHIIQKMLLELNNTNYNTTNRIARTQTFYTSLNYGSPSYVYLPFSLDAAIIRVYDSHYGMIDITSTLNIQHSNGTQITITPTSNTCTQVKVVVIG